MIKKAWKRSDVQIDAKALTFNYKALRNCVGKNIKTMCVVKGDAYGHGLETCVQILQKSNPDYYAVFSMEEGIRVRKIDRKTSILVLCPANSSFVLLAQKYNLTLSLSSVDTFVHIVQIKTKKIIKLHLCIESGLGRDGIQEKDLSRVLALVHGKKYMCIEGIYTHFSGAESRTFDRLTTIQTNTLSRWKNAFREVGIHPLFHASGTAGALLGSDFHFDMCRFGLGLYGLWPSDETKNLHPTLILRSVLSWTTRIVEIKELGIGHGIGYDSTYVTNEITKIAVIPVGYYDGLPRTLSNNCDMLVRGKYVPLRGRVMMNMCVLDVTNVRGVKLGDEVVIIGKQAKEEITVDELALRAGTINYELVTRLHR